jgi:rhodanese-related sulfurtransferase
MPQELHDRNAVRELIERGVQLVEVLGPEEFDEEHLPGAINLLLRKVETDARARLDPGKAVVLYCWDSA